MLRRLFSLLTCLCATPSQADCTGPGLNDLLVPATQARIAEQAALHPFAEGLIWHAENDSQSILFVAQPRWATDEYADLLEISLDLAERTNLTIVGFFAGTPEDEAATRRAFVDDPSLMFLTEGSLIDLLPAEDWELVQRMVPTSAFGIMSAKIRPTFAVSTALEFSCFGRSEHSTFYRAVEQRLRTRGVPLAATRDPIDALAAFGDVPLQDRLRWMIATLSMIDSLDKAAVEAETEGWQSGRLVEADMLIAELTNQARTTLSPDDLAAFDRLEDRDDTATAVDFHTAIDQALSECLPAITVLTTPRTLIGPTGLLAHYADQGWRISRLDLPTRADTLANAEVAISRAGFPCTG